MTPVLLIPGDKPSQLMGAGVAGGGAHGAYQSEHTVLHCFIGPTICVNKFIDKSLQNRCKFIEYYRF